MYPKLKWLCKLRTDNLEKVLPKGFRPQQMHMYALDHQMSYWLPVINIRQNYDILIIVLKQVNL